METLMIFLNNLLFFVLDNTRNILDLLLASFIDFLFIFLNIFDTILDIRSLPLRASHLLFHKALQNAQFLKHLDYTDLFFQLFKSFDKYTVASLLLADVCLFGTDKVKV